MKSRVLSGSHGHASILKAKPSLFVLLDAWNLQFEKQGTTFPGDDGQEHLT
jgi:hypothetical protein